MKLSAAQRKVSDWLVGRQPGTGESNHLKELKQVKEAKRMVPLLQKKGLNREEKTTILNEDGITKSGSKESSC